MQDQWVQAYYPVKKGLGMISDSSDSFSKSEDRLSNFEIKELRKILKDKSKMANSHD